MKVDPRDKQEVLNWMRTYCNGFRKARNKEDIIPHIRTTIPCMSERYFRACISELIHDDECASTSALGYWWIPAVNLPYDHDEKQAVLGAIRERKSRALKQLEDTSRQERKFMGEGLQMTMGFDEEIGSMADGIDKMGAR
jgi:hypothetical protein